MIFVWTSCRITFKDARCCTINKAFTNGVQESFIIVYQLARTKEFLVAECLLNWSNVNHETIMTFSLTVAFEYADLDKLLITFDRMERLFIFNAFDSIEPHNFCPPKNFLWCNSMLFAVLFQKKSNFLTSVAFAKTFQLVLLHYVPVFARVNNF